MSLIGTLEQLNLPLVLQGIETYAKTGLLVIKQEALWIELYFRDGRLMCIGPVQANATLGDRLLQAGVISRQALQEAIFATSVAQPGETRIALTLMDLGYVSHEQLRAWATKEATEVLQVLLTWQSGEIYFEEEQPPPTDRLLVALSSTALLPSISSVAASVQPFSAPLPPTRSEVLTPFVQEQPGPISPAQQSGFINAAQLVEDVSTNSGSLFSPEAAMSSGDAPGNSNVPTSSPLSTPRRLMVPRQSSPVDTTFLRPEMVLLPVDLSGLRAQNPLLRLTPEQWRLLTKVDGRTSLESICQELAMSISFVRQVTGELIALGVVQTSYPLQEMPVNASSPVSQNLHTSGSGNDNVAPAYAAMPPQPWATFTPTTEALPPTFTVASPFETKSQWGNGGNGATFVPGQGWIATPQPLQLVQQGGPFYATNNIYAQVEVRR